MYEFLVHDCAGNLKTVFTDLSREEIGQGLYLVCRLYRKGSLLPADAKTKSSKRSRADGDIYKRPFGCSVLQLTNCGVGGMGVQDQVH